MLKKFKNSLRLAKSGLSRTICYRHLRGGVSAPAGSYGRVQWVLARPLYRYARFDLKSVPKAQRRQALALQIRQWSPFENPGWYLVWEGDTAQIWAWDSASIDAAIRAQGRKPANVAIVPESLLHQRQQTGVLLVSCLEGLEGQVWDGGSLVASRWWAQTPDAAEWRNFLRDSGGVRLSTDPAVPVPSSPVWQGQPWAKSAAAALTSASRGAAEWWLVKGVTLCLAGGTFWYGAELVKLENAITERTVELETLNQNSAAILEARGQALEALDRIKQLQALDPYPSQLSLLAKVAESLPKDGAYLREWDFQNGKLKLQIASPNKLASSEIIKQFQTAGIFNNVLTATGSEPNNAALTMEIQPYSDVTFAVENTSVPLKKDGDKPPLLVPPLR